MLLCLYTFQEGVQSPPAACTRGERLAAAHASVKRRGAPLWRGAAAQRCLCAAGSPLTGSRAVAGGEVCEFDAEMRRALRAATARPPKKPLRVWRRWRRSVAARARGPYLACSRCWGVGRGFLRGAQRRSVSESGLVAWCAAGTRACARPRRRAAPESTVVARRSRESAWEGSVSTDGR